MGVWVFWPKKSKNLDFTEHLGADLSNKKDFKKDLKAQCLDVIMVWRGYFVNTIG